MFTRASEWEAELGQGIEKLVRSFFVIEKKGRS